MKITLADGKDVREELLEMSSPNKENATGVASSVPMRTTSKYVTEIYVLHSASKVLRTVI